MKHIFKMGNTKLSRAVGIFNLPTWITCVGKTILCTKICFARRPELFRPAVLPYRQRNLEESQDPGFVDKATREIKDRKIKYVRWHESGDVYSQEYLNKIYEICKACPDTRFWMYTKSHCVFDWSGKPANLAIYLSIDRTTPEDWREKMHPSLKDCPTAYLLMPGETPDPSWVTCNPGGLKHEYCMDSCKTCIAGKLSVYFKKH